VPAIKRNGIASLVYFASKLCRVMALFDEEIQSVLTSDELTVYLALKAACTAFMAKFPLTQ
jgi:hypothetical protein